MEYCSKMNRKTKKLKCPKCNSKETVPIVYGLPPMELVEEANRGEIALGGCCVVPDQPEWQCKSCDYEFK